MKYFIDANNKFHAFEADGSQDFLIESDFVPATDAQVQAIQNPIIAPKDQAKLNINLEESKIPAPRAIRELLLLLAEQTPALLTSLAYTKLKAIDTKIVDLRKQL